MSGGSFKVERFSLVGGVGPRHVLNKQSLFFTFIYANAHPCFIVRIHPGYSSVTIRWLGAHRKAY
jgi:hypothetical protein